MLRPISRLTRTATRSFRRPIWETWMRAYSSIASSTMRLLPAAMAPATRGTARKSGSATRPGPWTPSATRTATSRGRGSSRSGAPRRPRSQSTVTPRTSAMRRSLPAPGSFLPSS